MDHRFAVYERFSDHQGPRLRRWRQSFRLAARPRARHTRRQRHLFRPESVFLREHSLERHCEGEQVNVNSAAIAFTVDVLNLRKQRHESDRPMGAHDIVSLLEPDGPRQFLLERLGAWRGTAVVSSTAHPVVAAAPRPVPDHPGRLTTRRLQSHDNAPTHLRGLRGTSYAF
jgi:hypothetical protein